MNAAGDQEEIDRAVEVLKAAVASFKAAQIPTGTIDTSALDSEIAAAEVLIDQAEAGTEAGQYPQEAIDALEAAITAALAAKEDAETQEEIDGAVEVLKAAVASFKATQIPTGTIDTSALDSEIAAAEALIDQAEAGTEAGQYPQEAIDAF